MRPILETGFDPGVADTVEAAGASGGCERVMQGHLLPSPLHR